MKKILILLNLVFMSVLIIGCSEQAEEQNSQMANPASVYCEEQGGVLEIRTAVSGSQLGYCTLPGGVECEEWAYYRGEYPA